MSSNDEFNTLILHSDQDASENEHNDHLTFDDDELAAANGACCDPSSACYRFIVLILMCLVGFAINFCYDNPAALQNYFIKDMSMSNTQYIWMYSIYSWPNVILAVIGGYLSDRVFGIRFAMILYISISMIGQLIVAIGVICNAYWMMLLGRFIFGCGGESIVVTRCNYAVRWFKGKELNMAFGLLYSFAGIGSTANFIVMEPIYKYVNQWYTGHTCLGIVMLISFTTCIMSFTCAILLGWLDQRAESIIQQNDNTNRDIAKLSDVKTFKATFWMVCCISMLYTSTLGPFINLVKMFFMQKYDFSSQNANSVNSLVYAIVTVACPLFGYIVDTTGKNLSWVFLSLVAMIITHSFFAFTYVSPYVCMTLLGLASTMISTSLLPLVSLIVPEHQLGIAYGISLSMSNLTVAVLSIFCGIIVDHFGYFTLEIFIIWLLELGLILTIWLWFYSTSKNGILNSTPNERKFQLALKLSSNENEQLLNSENSHPIENGAANWGVNS